MKTSGNKVREYEDIKDADGVEGFIICYFDQANNIDMRFRVYDKVNLDKRGNWTFYDYPIRHSDLEVKIVGEAAFYHTKDGKYYLDHSPKALGMTEVLDEE